jgi:aspartate kinase
VRDVILEKLQLFRPDDVRVQDDIALICTVGEGMRHRLGVSAAVSSALAKSRINILLELQGGSEINVMRGVRQVDADNAVRALYKKFF